ncbi:phosphotransferase [Microlunatus speluncae]|uniref:phosphotransferase n=1 Tax=Microlunatus speluncae TaxID=2594267 RepID=UPI0013759773|nr:phosphotransferase [Microlunatus speluncae]
MRQGAVGQVRLVEHAGRSLVEKRFTDPARHQTEVLALRALAHGALPVPELIKVDPGSILISLLPGDRLDEVGADAGLAGLSASVPLLRSLHEVPAPPGLPAPPDDALIIRRYRAAGGPPLPLSVPAPHRPVFCHGDWTDANLLAVDGRITGVIDWEATHVGDPLRELSRVAWGASRRDPRAFKIIVEAYGADLAEVRSWSAIHAAELWLWFLEAGPPDYLEQLTTELLRWPSAGDVRDTGH